MKIKYLLVLCVIAGCSKKGNSAALKPSTVSFLYIDNETSNGRIDTLSNGRFVMQSGGNQLNNDTTHGYWFSASGGSGSNLSLTFEVPRLASGKYTYAAFSPSWPYPLGLDAWEYRDGTFLDPVNAAIVLGISRYSDGTLDGTFSINFANGSSYMTLSNGVLTNIPVHQ